MWLGLVEPPRLRLVPHSMQGWWRRVSGCRVQHGQAAKCRASAMAAVCTRERCSRGVRGCWLRQLLHQ
jgi:hypothetical protein